MALYEHRCRTCDSTFEARRPMAEANDPISCPDGHPSAVRMLSVFASVGAASPSSGAPAPAPMPMSGGCCGGGCHTH